MPEESTWENFFDPLVILAKLGVSQTTRDVAEFGCGYGTFTVSVAQMVSGTVHAFDIDRTMIAATRRRIRRERLHNIRVHLRDFMAKGTGLKGSSVDFVMLFNILHAARPEIIFREAYRILLPRGTLGIIHWNYDPKTPRGPSMAIRPKPEQCRVWAENVGFVPVISHIDLPPYHYGLLLSR